MRFQVPQFLDIEDKIVGPLTLKQFLYVAAAGALSFVLFYILQTWLWAIATVFLGGIAAGLAFAKYNGQTMPVILLAAARYFWEPKFYIWRRVTATPQSPKLAPAGSSADSTPSIKNLWLKMTTSSQPIEKREKAFAPFAMFKKSNELLEKFESFKKQEGDREFLKRVDYR